MAASIVVTYDGRGVASMLFAATLLASAIELSPNEQAVYDTLNSEEVPIDDIIRKSGLPPSVVSVALLSLEMKRLVRQLPGKLFVRNT